MSFQGAGNVGRTAGKVDNDLAVKILAGQIVIVRIRNVESIADEDQRRLDALRLRQAAAQ